jgi:hypothetical protein
VTAEVAILNKLAVALAADSAVTVGHGGESKKVFNTADKLFELSSEQPIACMIFSGGQFMQAPLPVLIKDFRSKQHTADTVRSLADELLSHFQQFAADSPHDVKSRPIYDLTWKITDFLSDRFQEQLAQRIGTLGKTNEESGEAITPEILLDLIWDHTVKLLERIAGSWAEVKFLGTYPSNDAVREHIESALYGAEFQVRGPFKERVVAIIADALRKATPFSPSTGLVVAGFGAKELFPTLVHIDIFEPVLGVVKFREVETVDIDRKGPKSRVMAFAQREMAERFLFGLDSSLKRKLSQFAKSTVNKIGETILAGLTFSNDDERDSLADAIEVAERSFIDEFDQTGMGAIRDESQQAVEDMVEFMPKQDLAEFAEALVNLSSLQRRVHSGFETVGGPIDVAVISKAEGLVWVKRKHYFPADLNARFFKRLGVAHG